VDAIRDAVVSAAGEHVNVGVHGPGNRLVLTGHADHVQRVREVVTKLEVQTND
jgi:hypothetical protein